MHRHRRLSPESRNPDFIETSAKDQLDDLSAVRRAAHQEAVRTQIVAAGLRGNDHDQVPDLTAALLGAAAAPAVAATGSDGDAPQRTVRFADLNLATAAGVATLDARLDAAIRSVCPSGFGNLIERRDMQDCRSAARARIAPVRTAVIAVAQSKGGPQMALLAVH